MKKSIIAFALGFCVAASVSIVISGKANPEKTGNDKNKAKSETVTYDTQNNKVIHSPKSISFAGEKMPLQYFDVRESLEKELNNITYAHYSTILTTRLTRHYFKTMEKILEEEGVPDDFKYLCVAESHLQNLTSSAKAAGFWQFLTETGQKYNLGINDEVDERYNIEKSTIATCKYIKEAYGKFGNWTLSSASYNTGIKNIEKAMLQQKTNNYCDMIFHPETNRYIYRIVAYKIILKNLDAYCFYIKDKDKFDPLEYSEITMNEPIGDIAEFAAKNVTNYKMLKIFNPWIRKNKLTNKLGKTYKINIPTKNFRETAE